MRYRPYPPTASDAAEQRDRVRAVIAPSTSSPPMARGTCWYFWPANVRSVRPRRRYANNIPATPRIMPLYARLSSAERLASFGRIGDAGSCLDQRCRTSITVPGVRYVVRAGTADLSVQPSIEGAAAADRTRVEGVGEPARRRAAAGCRQACASGSTHRTDYDDRARVHRARDPAHQPGVGHSSDDGDRSR